MSVWVLANKAEVLMILLTLSELMAVVMPRWGGFLASFINIVKMMGGKDISQK